MRRRHPKSDPDQHAMLAMFQTEVEVRVDKSEDFGKPPRAGRRAELSLEVSEKETGIALSCCLQGFPSFPREVVGV